MHNNIIKAHGTNTERVYYLYPRVTSITQIYEKNLNIQKEVLSLDFNFDVIFFFSF